MNFLRGVMGGQSAGPQHTEAETVSAAPGPGWGRAGRERGIHAALFTFLLLARTRELPTRRRSPGRGDRRASGTRHGHGPRGPSLLPFNLSVGRLASMRAEARLRKAGRRLKPSCWRRLVAKNKTIFLGHNATCSCSISCKNGRLLRWFVGGSDPTFQVHPNVSCGSTSFARRSNLRANHSRDSSALLVT